VNNWLVGAIVSIAKPQILVIENSEGEMGKTNKSYASQGSGERGYVPLLGFALRGPLLG
jgi:hypothetical protein